MAVFIILAYNYLLWREAKEKQMYSGKKEYKPVNDKAIIPLTVHQINSELK
jgi:hypothetical protein